ncbi:MAG TPA: BCCT family transporter [Rubrobacteraceae bacterium]|nr:BCCT family transporter [Rubrobacteraceae bacterium]
MQGLRNLTSQVGTVFWITLAIALAFVLWGVLLTDNFDKVTRAALEFVVADLSWFYLIVTTLFLVFVLFLAFSRYGKIKLGKEDEEPEFGMFSWFAMLFQAGMGIGVIFWGVSEPVLHYASQPPYGGAEPNTAAAAQLSMQYSFFHWGLHAWAIYAVVALAVAYFNFRKDKPGLISAVLSPLLGDRANGPIGKAIDVLAILATLFGVAVSLGLGTLQIGAGLGESLGISNGIGPQLIIIGITTIAFMLSASTPIDKGVNYLSQASIYMAATLLLFIILVGPTVVQLNAFTQGIGDYLGQLIPMSFTMNAFNQDTAFLSSPAGTLFLFATWIAWAPYVGVFVARVSRGRTIREFVIGVLVAPSLANALWFAVFGGAAIDYDRSTGGAISAAAQSDPAVGLFAFLQAYPLPLITSLAAILLLFIFFVAGADAATIVLGRMSAGGVLNPGRVIRLVWGAIMAAIAAVLLLTGGLEALERASILGGLPFALIMIAMCWSLYKGLSQDAHEEDQQEESQQSEETTDQTAQNPGK